MIHTASAAVRWRSPLRAIRRRARDPLRLIGEAGLALDGLSTPEVPHPVGRRPGRQRP